MKFAHIAAAALLAVSAAAQAAPVTVQFTAVIDYSDVEGYDFDTPVSGHFTYDSDMPAVEQQDLGDGISLLTYQLEGPNSFTLNIGNDVLTFSTLGIAMLDTDGTIEIGEALGIMAMDMSLNGIPGGLGAVSLNLNTSGGNPNVLSLSLPTSLSLADFDDSAYGSFYSDASSFSNSANFTLTSLSTSPVPEPSAALSMLLGLGLVGGALWGRRAQSAR